MRIQAKMLKQGMTLNGATIAQARPGAGSAKGWMYLRYEDGQQHRDRIRGTEYVEVG